MEVAMLRFSRLGVAALLAALVACGDRGADSPATAPAEPPGADAPAEPPVPATAPSGSPAAEPARPELSVPPPRFPRGLITSRPEVTPGYVLFNPTLSDTAYLVDNQGRVVHQWETRFGAGGDIELLPNSHLLRGGRDPENLRFKAGGTGGILQELDWDGRVVWEWRLSDDRRVHHHDVTALPNGNVLLLAWEVKSPDEVRRAGRRDDLIPEQGLWVDYVLEIEPVRPEGARVVWEWHVWDHLIQGHDPQAANHGDPAEHPERLDVNADAGAPPIDPAQLEQLKALGYVHPQATPQDLRADFLHVNTVAYHPRLDQIALSVPVLGEIWMVDHSTTTAEAAGSAGGRSGRGGDLLYRWGNPAAYGRGGPGNAAKRLFYQHDVRWIPDGETGAGNLTVFNNGRDRPEGAWSSIDEWTPPLEGDGRYALDGGAYGPTELAWQYRAPHPPDFFAPFVSGAHRIENGNTLICIGTDGTILEVTRAGEVVWEFRNPFSGDVRNADGSPPQPRADERPFAMFRATRIPADHPALAGRTLTPLDPQPAWFEARAPQPGEGR
jgi:hypothetical protein